jgi:LacI family transcriptional regulator
VKEQTTPATIYDIAKLAGVNPSTVSRALTSPGRLNAKTEAKIRAAAKELNYRANPFARALPTGRTKMIGLMIADITNPMFSNAVRGAEAMAMKYGYTLVIAESQESTIIEASALEKIQAAVDGLIMVTTRLSDEQIREINSQKPIVLMNRVVKGVEDVVPQNAPGIEEAIKHLASQGHKHIGFLSGPSNSWMSNERWKLLMKSALSHKMTIVEIGPNSPSIEGGKDALDRVIASGITAVVAYNDLVAIGLMRSAQERGYTIPADLSIIGFDNIFGSDFTSPPLTTIQMPLNEVGARAVEALLKSLGEEIETGQYETLTTSLVTRESTEKAKG